MKLKKELLLLIFLNSLIIFGQESKDKEMFENSINKYTKGISFIVSDTGINSELNEIGTTFFKNKYIILSNERRRFAKETIDSITKIPYNNLYCVDIKEDGNLSLPLLFSKSLDSKKEEGSIGFSPNQEIIFFTKENSKNKEIHSLYKATLDEDNPKKWINITPINIVSDGYSVETPSLSPDGKKIYLASNMPGGFGGFDIYEALIDEYGTIGDLRNLGANVNTAADEKYPQMSSDSKYLYFSSKGHLNLGGFDIFRSANVNNSFVAAMNLGTDLNTKKDDIAFIMISPSKGYISTNNNKLGNFDILKFEIKKQENLFSSYTIVEETTNIPLPNAIIVVTDEFGNKLITTQSDIDGKIKLNLEPLTAYEIEVVKDGYETKKINIASGDIEKNIILSPVRPIITDDQIIIENIYFDFDKAIIKKESELSLNKIIAILSTNTSMNIIINAHTDSKGSEKYNQKLSERRAKAAYEYLIKKGINSTQLSHKGYGEKELLEKCSKCSAAQNQINRRIEFKILK